MFCVFRHTYPGPLLGACFLSFWVFFGVSFGSLLVPKVVLGVVLEASKKRKKEMATILGVPGDVGGCLIITSGLWLSWVMVRLGPQKGAEGSGWQLVTPCVRSAVADNRIIRLLIDY